MELKKNQFQCPRCKDILTSESNYDLQKCSCGALAIDGGENLRVIEIDATAFSDDIFQKMAEEMLDDGYFWKNKDQAK